MTWTKEQRAMMAADLAERAAYKIRANRDGIGALTESVSHVLWGTAPERCYREALGGASLSPADIDAAVAAIARGEHPADSLPGKVERMRAQAAADEQACGSSSDDGIIAFGEGLVCKTILELLGCEVTP